MEMEVHHCKNCGNQFTEVFCNRCGQKDAHRITLAHIGHDLVHAFIHADKGIISLFLQLFTHPGRVAREYIIEGRRKRYFNPFQYLLIIASIATVIVANSHFIEQIPTYSPFGMGNYSQKQGQFIKQMMALMSKYFNVVILLQIPFYALASFIIYRRYRLNFAEHLTLHTFMAAQVTVITTFIMVVAMGTNPQLYYTFGTIASVAYYLFALMPFFGELSFKGGLRAVGWNILGYVFYMTFISLFMAAAVIIFLLFLKK